MDVAGDVLLVLGAAFALIAAIGVHRFPDIYSRMHAAAKAPTLGLILAGIGASFRIGTLEATATLALVVVLQLLTQPIGTHVLSRAVHLRVRVPQDGVDEFERDKARPGAVFDVAHDDVAHEGAPERTWETGDDLDG